MQRTNQKKELLHFRIALVVFDIQDGSGIGIDKIGNFILGMFAVWIEMPYDVFMGRIYRAVQPTEKGEYYA